MHEAHDGGGGEEVDGVKVDRVLRILIVRTGAMGDVLHGLPAIAALRERDSRCFIGWAIEPHWRPLLASADGLRRGVSMPLIDRVHEVPTRLWKQRPFALTTLREIGGLRREMKAERYDVCVDLQGSVRSAVIGRLSGARRFVGAQRPREGLARFLYKERVQPQAEAVIEQACELVGEASGQASLKPARVVLPIEMEAERWAEKTLRDLGIDTSARIVLMVPTAGWGAKAWPVEHYRELAKRLHAAGFCVLVNASGAADATAQSVAGEDAAVVESTLPQLIALTRRMNLVIGGDTGPVHLAAALGRRVIALFGPTDPVRNGPSFLDARTRVLRHPESRTSYKRTAETEAGLAKIGVEEIYAAAAMMLNAEEEGERG